MNRRSVAVILPVLLGVALIIAGLLWKTPGAALTTYKSLNGETVDYYARGDTYSSIDEYVGGDAYNYIIGASLVAGEISGVIVSKTICIVGGILCLCIGTMAAVVGQCNKESVLDQSQE